jgi:uncharacterized protein (TIGR02001 family)
VSPAPRAAEPRRRAAAVLVAAALCGLAAPPLVAPAAAAPLGAGLGLGVEAVSDYRYRGSSLSDERPAASLDVSLDHPSGLYAGARLIAAKPRGQGVELVGRMHYAGYVARRSPSLALDVGAINYNLTNYRGRKRTVDYNELYAGVVGEHFNAHLYYAPDYYQTRVRTLYADLGASFRPAPQLRLFGHVGALTGVGGRSFPRARKTRYDLKAGAAVDLGSAQVSLSWTKLTPAFVPRALGGPRSQRLELGLAYFF